MKPVQKSLECDVLVVGGGIAGCCAALAAAREGASVILCQDRSVLGGNASSEIRMHIVGADSNGYRCDRPLEVEAREGGIIEELRLIQACENPTRSPHGIDQAFYTLLRNEKSLTMLLDTRVYEAHLKDGRITSVRASRPSHEQEFEITAACYVDASGDSGMAVSAGNPFRHGRESKAEFNEPDAQDQPDKQTLGSTVLFQAKRLDHPVPFVAPEWARKFTEEDLRNRPHSLKSSAGGEEVGYEYGFWWLEWGGDLDTIRDNDTIRHELLAIAYGIWDHLKNGGAHSAENYALTWVGMLPGKRESRRLIGRATLTQQDVLTARDWDDAIAYGGWFMDLHPPKGVDDQDSDPCIQIHVPNLYSIPLGACASPTVENLYFAGRNISATHVAFASTRVMGTCGVVGQGVGITAAYAAKNGLTISQITGTALKEIQQRILRQDGFLIGLRNEDEADLALKATITASSETAAGSAQNLLSGVTRSVHGELGVKSGRSVEGTHRWISREVPAWVELRWDQPVTLERVQLVFDTGLHRWLSLTQSDVVHKRNVWHAQPETVRDYTLSVLDENGQWEPVLEVKNNFQRWRVHRFEARSTKALRVDVSATNGLAEARILEIRCY